MDILNSSWFIRMVEKAGATPRERLLAVFDILDDWLDAPRIREQLDAAEPDAAAPQVLLDYLTAQAHASGVQDPESLASQIYYLSVSMLREELRSPGCTASQHAKQVAQALIQAQTEKPRLITKRSAYAMAASVFVITGIAGVVAFTQLRPSTPQQNATLPPVSNIVTAKQTRSIEARPEQTAALFAIIEQMRKGECQYPEALLLPDAHKAVYLTNVVEGQISTNTEDQELVLQLLKKVRCNYTPMLMSNSTG